MQSEYTVHLLRTQKEFDTLEEVIRYVQWVNSMVYLMVVHNPTKRKWSMYQNIDLRDAIRHGHSNTIKRIYNNIRDELTNAFLPVVTSETVTNDDTTDVKTELLTVIRNLVDVFEPTCRFSSGLDALSINDARKVLEKYDVKPLVNEVSRSDDDTSRDVQTKTETLYIVEIFGAKICFTDLDEVISYVYSINNRGVVKISSTTSSAIVCVYNESVSYIRNQLRHTFDPDSKTT